MNQHHERPVKVIIEKHYRDIQKLFEKHLRDFEEGLRYISSFLGVGVGIIDTLAVDEDYRPVIIEYKKPGNSERDALIQALHYYYWCSTHFEWVDQAVRKFKPDLLKGEDTLNNDIRIPFSGLDRSCIKDLCVPDKLLETISLVR